MISLHQLVLKLVAFSLLMMLVTTVNADSFKSLLMPGKVIQGHEEYEEQCDNCHDTSNKDRQGQLCINCHAHENIADDLSNKSGFHGRLPTKAGTDCKHCHTEHKGRNENIILLNVSNFDHFKTDFALKGIHKKTSCDRCHKPEKKYSEAPGDCYSCHEKADVHEGKQGKKCADCHTASGWKKTEFDHKDTDFPLKGAHKETRCSSCHINQEYKDTPKLCIDCHQINDSHRGNFGKKCDDCHNSVKWTEGKFDHDKNTDFSLFGQHKKTSCNSCHLAENYKKLISKAEKSAGNKKTRVIECIGCHKNDDSHKGRYGKKCKDCHTSSSWQKQKFDHNKTDFKLLGKHKKTPCNQCHIGDLYKDELKKTSCFDCHRGNDVHKSKQGKKCNNCHNENGWNDNVFFDHDLSSFPLIGMHAATQCEECHLSSEYSSTKSECNFCHASDDVHKTRLGTNCEACHNPNSWETWLFDHNKSTDFKIDGAHEEVGCYDCHRTASKGKLTASKDCISCHRSRDIHNRQFGRHCDNCHSTKSFKDINIKR